MSRSFPSSLLRMALAVPWCCVLTLITSASALGGGMLGLMFDAWFHEVMIVLIPLLALIHLYGIAQYFRHGHRTTAHTVLILMSTLIFVLSIGFHATDLHDELLGISHAH